jgi:WD40 repeat protein
LTSRAPGALAEQGAEARLFFTPDGTQLFGSCRDDDGYRWRIIPATNAATPPRLERLPLHKPQGFSSLCLSSNLVVLTSSNGSQLLAPKDIETGTDRWVRTYAGISRASSDGRWLGIYPSYAWALYVYSLPGLERVAKLTHPAPISGFQFIPQTHEVAIYSSRGGLEFWSTATWERTHSLTNFRGVIAAPDRRGWWLTKDTRTSGLYDATTLQPLLLLPSGTLPLAVSPDGRQLAVSVDARHLQLWDLVELRKRFRELGVDWSNEQSQTRTARR